MIDIPDEAIDDGTIVLRAVEWESTVWTSIKWRQLTERTIAAALPVLRAQIADEINLEAAQHPGVEADASDFNLGVYNGFRHAARIARGIAERVAREGNQQ